MAASNQRKNHHPAKPADQAHDSGGTQAGVDLPMTAEMLERVLNSIPHAVFVKDRQHRWILMNDEACALLGRTREEILGRTDHDLLPKEQADGYWAVDDAVFDSGVEQAVEEELTAADGTLRILKTRKRRLMMAVPHGDVCPLLLVSVTDITEIRTAETALRESEAHYRYSVELNPQIPWTAAPDGMITEAGPRWSEHTGMPLEQVKGAGWMGQVHPEDLPATRQSWEASLLSGEPFDREYRVRLRTGDYHWFRARAAARREQHGRIVRWYGTLENIHDRKLAEAALRDSEAFSRGILENSPNSIRVLDLDGRLLYMNATAVRMLEIGNGQALVGELWTNMIPPAHRADAQTALAVAKAGGKGHFTICRQRRDGSLQWLETVTSPIPGEDGNVARLLAISTDATETRQAREAVQLAQRDVEDLAKRLSAVLESTMDSVIVLDSAWCLTYFNGNAAQALKARKPELGRRIWDMFPDDVDGVFARHFRRSLDQQVPVAFEEYMPGLNAWLEVNACPTADGISIFFRDVTERRRAEQERLTAQEKMAHMARHDALTGVPNRLLFRERLERALHERHGGISAAVLCLDLDGFKAVNDTFGHPAGDAVLLQVAERLRNCVRGSDTVARLGGDEFAIVQAGIERPEDAGFLARRIVELLSRPIEWDGERVVVGASVGVAIVPRDGATADELLRAADIALYRAKAEGTGTYRFFEPGMDEQLRERHAVKRSLHEALAGQQFELYYQPQYDLSTGGITCFEALIRWRHPDLGLVSPADFIPIAEETGLIVPIGEWVLHEACRQAIAWPASIGVAVNLSPVQFRGGKLVGIVSGVLAACGLEPSRLQLEITESVMLQEDSSNLAILQELRRLGIRIAMDDFGTGYSSLSYLRSFPFDKIKLDRSFVNAVRDGREARAILHAVAGLGAGFNILTAAEGIETPDQLMAVQDEGYDEGQGYLLSPPVTAQEALELIRAAEMGNSPVAQAAGGEPAARDG